MTTDTPMLALLRQKTAEAEQRLRDDMNAAIMNGEPLTKSYMDSLDDEDYDY